MHAKAIDLGGMSALAPGQVRCTTALPPKADVDPRSYDVAQVTNADLRGSCPDMVAADRGRHASASLELHSFLQSAIAAKAFNVVVGLGLLHGYPSRIEPDD
jgi:hypothetical protein